MTIVNPSTENEYHTLQVRFEDDIGFIRIYRPDANNAINQQLISEFFTALRQCETIAKIVVLEGLPHVFCFGADFTEIEAASNTIATEQDPEPLYNVWLTLATAPFLTIAHVQGKANAGGVGFVAACDIVLCEEKATFSLSELLFGLLPACVLPFLIRRIGFAKANYMTLMTQPISAQQALQWGLVDAYESNSNDLLRKHLLRLRRLSKTAIGRHKRYLHQLDGFLHQAKAKALDMNIEVFSDSENKEKISRYVKTGQFPWE